MDLHTKMQNDTTWKIYLKNIYFAAGKMLPHLKEKHASLREPMHPR